MSNSISVIGNIGKDAETREAGNSTVTNFSLANSVGFGDRKQTIWFDCAIWGKQGDRLQQHLTKGTKVFVSGEMSQREYNGKTYLQIEVKSFDFAESRQNPGNNELPPKDMGTGEDVPF